MKWLSGLKLRKLFFFAGCVALCVFFVVYFALSELDKSKESSTVAPTPATKDVIVAKSNIAVNTILTGELLTVKSLPEDTVPKNALNDLNLVVNRKAKAPIFAGDFITEVKLFKPGERGGFIASIPADCRAISIPITDVTGVAGFAKPGDFVDVVLVEKNDSLALSTLLLQNVLLLSINDNAGGEIVSDEQSADHDKEKKSNSKNSSESENASGAIQNPHIATLALKPEEVLQLASASKLGEIYLILRPENPKTLYMDDHHYAIQSAKLPSTQSAEKPQQPASAKNEAPVKPETENPPEKVSQPENSPPKIEIFYGDEQEQSEVSKK